MMTAGSKQYVVGNKGNHGVAQIHGVDETKIQANARLIAAAPDLLAALNACLPWLAKCAADHDGTPETGINASVMRRHAQAAAAIAKATATPETGTHTNPIRYERIEATDPQRAAKRAQQLDQFTNDAKAGKVLCLSDLMSNAGM